MYSDWTYSINKYNAATFEDGISALCIGITIYHASDEYHEIGERCIEPLGVSIKYEYKHCICTELNISEDSLHIQLRDGSFTELVTSPFPPTIKPLVVATIQDTNNLLEVILHPLYSGRNISISHQKNSHNGLFGSRFGVTFQGRDD